MGCPPDPYEVGAAHAIEEGTRQRDRYAVLWEESQDALAAARQLLETVRGHDALVNALKSALEPLRQRPSEAQSPPHTVSPLHAWPENWSQEVDAPLHAVSAETKGIETELCIARDALLRLARDCGAVTDELTRERHRHLDHRREDKQMKLATLRRDLQVVQYARKDPSPLESRTPAELAAEQQRLVKEIERILALTDDQLLRSRDLF